MPTGFESYPKLYGSSRWRAISKRHLDLNPLCAPCLLSQKETGANTVHHKIPHKGDVSLFFDPSNLESVCPSCHSGIKRMEENHGYSQACGADGLPLDANHPWAKERR
jgi:5-methylcytosine-specific restriction endonuclease McrA